MTKLLLFGGTSEEHELIRALAGLPVQITLCVASKYGQSMVQIDNDKLTVRCGRLNESQIMDLIIQERFSVVLDATHPYALEATKNISQAAEKLNIPYMRYLREKSHTGNAVIVPSIQAAVELLAGYSGTVLITTGSKELKAFTCIPDYKERLYLRVLPTVESIQSCLECDFSASHIIAMQGPFSKEFNIALMKQLNVKTLVTKDGGKNGGFPEKLEAAWELDIATIVIGRPDENGLSLCDIMERLKRLMEVASEH